MQTATIGLDIAKRMVQVHGADERGRAVLKRRLARPKVLGLFANLPPCLIGLEAGGGAPFWAREVAKLGHEGRPMAPPYVKPYGKTSEHDAADAEACCEAVRRPRMRCVAVKTEPPQALLMLHRMRDRRGAERTGSTDAMRGHRAESSGLSPRKARPG